MANLILSKESSESEIKEYFNVVLKLSQSDNEFPINLEEVWPLLYGQKSDAVQALKNAFIEGVDYQALRQNPQNPYGGRPTTDYYITVSCMEFFIARKVRPVFEVYRQVFHGAAKIAVEKKRKAKTEPVLMTKMRVGFEWAKKVSKMLNLDNPSKRDLLEKVGEPLELPVPDAVDTEVFLSITALLKKKGYDVSGRNANKMLECAGIIEKIERYSKSKKKNVFQWSITKKGSKYGKMHQDKNATYPSPVWSFETADQLIAEMMNGKEKLEKQSA